MKHALILAGLIAINTPAMASSIVERNPFDPQRKNWPLPPPPPPAPPPPLPVLTPQDIAIEAIVLFGEYRGILAQLSGKLKDSLPANAAGKVRIALGQSFGPGYVLSRVEPNQVVIEGHGSTSVVPLVRRVASGVPPAAAAANQPFAPATPPPPPPSASPPPPVPAVPAEAPPPAPVAPSPASSVPQPSDAAHAPTPVPPPAAPAATAPTASAAAPAPVDGAAAHAQPAQAAQPTQPVQPTAQPMTLLDAIRAAQERAKQSGAAPAPKLPFGGQ